MTETILAVYEEGVLKPLEPLHLKEQQKVYIQVVPEEAQEDQDDPIERLIQRLIREGRMQPRPPGPVPPDPLSEQEREELADRLGRAPGKPASEMVIEDRGEW